MGENGDLNNIGKEYAKNEMQSHLFYQRRCCMRRIVRTRLLPQRA